MLKEAEEAEEVEEEKRAKRVLVEKYEYQLFVSYE
jgi:hypothetical protein